MLKNFLLFLYKDFEVRNSSSFKNFAVDIIYYFHIFYKYYN